jgi:chromosome segregation ATPase
MLCSHEQQVTMLKTRLGQECNQLRISLELSQQRRRLDAANHAKLCADAADTLSHEIEKADKIKAAFEKTLEVTYASHDSYVAELREQYKSKLVEAQLKEQDDHEHHLETRNQLARAQHEVQDLRQKEQDIEELQEQHEQQLHKVRFSYQQELDKAQREFEQEKAHNEEYVCELETEMDEMCQEKDELYYSKSQLCEKMEEQYQDLEFSHEHEMVKAKEEIEQLKQSLRTTSDELKDAQAELTKADKLMVEIEATLHELCQQAQDSKVKHEQDLSKASGRRQELEEKTCKLVLELHVARLENMELGDQLKEVKKESQETQEREQKMKESGQEMEEREQELMSQCAADRLMFERTMQALRAMRQL